MLSRRAQRLWLFGILIWELQSSARFLAGDYEYQFLSHA